MNWNPTGFHVHLSGYTNWAGAYSTTGELLVLSSLAQDISGVYGLETIFHEGMHQWDKQVFEALREQARKQNKLVRNLETLPRRPNHPRPGPRRVGQTHGRRRQISALRISASSAIQMRSERRGTSIHLDHHPRTSRGECTYHHKSSGDQST